VRAVNFMLFYVAKLVLFLLLILFFVSLLVSFIVETSREFDTAYECGFDTFGRARVPFSMSFFLLALLFVVFDVEIVIFFPMCIVIYQWQSFIIVFVSVLFLWVLFFGLIYEY
jgi:NADH:ubiquinone oxidoreductase subunit 3 (subunit A)